MGRMEHLDPAALAAFQDAGLPPAERARATAHLAECAECRDRLGAQLRAAAGREGADRDEARGARVRGTGAIGPGRGARRELLAAAAIGALLLGGGLWWAADRVAEEREARLPERAATPPAPEAPAESPVTPSPTGGELAGVEPDRVPADPAAEPASEEGVEPELLALRGGTREVDGKTFRLEGDEWVDDTWAGPSGPVPIPLVRGTPAWLGALDERPALARYAEVGPRVLVVVDSLAFRILPAP